MNEVGARATLIVAVVAYLLPTVAGAQVLQQREEATDSLSLAYREALIVLRDTTSVVRRSLQNFTRALGRSSSAVIDQRVQRLHAACEAAVRAADEQRSVFDPADIDEEGRSNADSVRSKITVVRARLEQLAADLDRTCVRVFSPEGPRSEPDSLRAWGMHDASRVERALLGYTRAASALARIMDLKIPPRGMSQ